LRATLVEKHLAGLRPAPGKPAPKPMLEKLMRPTTQPTSNGPSLGPNTCCCRGSRPTPKQRNLITLDTNVDRWEDRHHAEAQNNFNQESLSFIDDIGIEQTSSTLVSLKISPHHHRFNCTNTYSFVRSFP